MNRISCDVIQDLLPLYHDQVCSQESRALVEEHLKTCPRCADLLNKIKIQCELSSQEEDKHEEIIRDMADAWKKAQKKSYRKGLLLALLICLLLVSGYQILEHWIMVPVPAQRIMALTAEESENYVKISYQAEIQSKVSDNTFTITDEGKYYFSNTESVLHDKKETSISDFSFTLSKKVTTDSGKQINLSGIYYGTPDDCVTVWEAD